MRTPSLAALVSPPWQGEKAAEGAERVDSVMPGTKALFSPCQGGDGAEGAEGVDS
jgi:hypothetical protein